MISLSKSNHDDDPIPMISQVCPRIVFRTASRKISDLLEESHPYNQVKIYHDHHPSHYYSSDDYSWVILWLQTACCLRSGIKPECMPLCTYDASLSQVGRGSWTWRHRLWRKSRIVGSWDNHHLHYDQQYQQHHLNPQVQWLKSLCTIDHDNN